MTTMLEQNYRSHPALLTLPSRLYYGDKLQSGPLAKDTLCQWTNLPKKGFPLFWHDVKGSIEDRNEHGSYCNLAEIDLVADYLETLVETTNVCPEEIGIITPYKYQVC
jgi:putative helicase MOV10L1